MYKLITSAITLLIFTVPLLLIFLTRGEQSEKTQPKVILIAYERTEEIDISEDVVIEDYSAELPIFMEPPSIDISLDETEYEWFDRLRETDYIAEPLYYGAPMDISDKERDLIERTVMHETGWCDDYRLLILVAQCIRNGCERFGQTPRETFDNFGYAAMSYANPRAKKAVSDVFDKGVKCVDEDIYCYYNRNMVSSDWHETQRLAIDIDGNRFFY